jgi:hypothetical protein
LLVVLTVFTTLALIRLPLLWLTSALTWGMHHTDRLMTPPTPPPSRDRHTTGGSPMPGDGNTARSRPPAWTGPTTPASTSDTSREILRDASHTAGHDASRDTGATRHDTATVPMSRPRRIVSWIGWHTLELSTVTGTLTLAVCVTGWFTIPAALIAILWAVHEIRLARQQRAMTARR